MSIYYWLGHAMTEAEAEEWKRLKPEESLPERAAPCAICEGKGAWHETQ